MTKSVSSRLVPKTIIVHPFNALIVKVKTPEGGVLTQRLSTT
jgi:hypothetical protein